MTTTRRTFCLQAGAALAAAPATAFQFFDSSTAGALLALPEARFRSFVQAANANLDEQPWSVTAHRPRDTPAGVHDFFSEGPYWWPDPKNPSGPYIRRDGEVNPDRFNENDRDLARLGESSLNLGLAAWRLRDAKYAAKLARNLRVWFVDPATRMNPDFEFGQAIRNITWGRGIGLIDARPLMYVTAGVELARRAPGWDPTLDAPLHDWFSAFLRWMRESKKGVDERNNGNNHATFWAAQVASYAHFTSHTAARADVWDFFRTTLVRQFLASGAAPKEEARTRSLSYSAMNLSGFALLCHMAALDGVSLWSHRQGNSGSVEQAIRYLLPYLEGGAAWKGPQITRFDFGGSYFLGLAGMGLPHQPWVDLAKRTLKPSGAWLNLHALMLDVWRAK